MSSDGKEPVYGEKHGSPTTSAVEPAQHGQVSNVKRRFHFSWEVRQEESSFAASKNASNADFDPIPPSKRTWNWGAYVAYWMADAWAVSNWEVGELPRDRAPSVELERKRGDADSFGRIASSMIAVGLNWKMAVGACVLGNTIMGLVITVNGRMGAIVGCSPARPRIRADMG